MNAFAMAQAAYTSAAAPLKTTRSSEYDAFAKITHKLRTASERKKIAFPEFVEALYENGKLWRLLVVDLASPNNELPDELKARLISLAEFIRKHTSAVLASQADEAALVEINTAVMRGLFRKEGV
jgi:flagellar protein FlaF